MRYGEPASNGHVLKAAPAHTNGTILTVNKGGTSPIPNSWVGTQMTTAESAKEGTLPVKQQLSVPDERLSLHSAPVYLRPMSVDGKLSNGNYQYRTVPHSRKLLIPVQTKSLKRMKGKAKHGGYIPVYYDGKSLSKKQQFGSLPNLHGKQAGKNYFITSEIPIERQAHVQDWLHSGHIPDQDVTDLGRRGSASSDPNLVGGDYDRHALWLKWSPSMQRRLQSKDRAEARSQLGVATQPVEVRRNVHLPYDTRSLPYKVIY